MMLGCSAPSCHCRLPYGQGYVYCSNSRGTDSICSTLQTSSPSSLHVSCTCTTHVQHQLHTWMHFSQVMPTHRHYDHIARSTRSAFHSCLTATVLPRASRQAHHYNCHRTTSMERSSMEPAGPGEVNVAGNPLHATTKASLAATGLIQPFKPFTKICQHVCAFHCYAHDASRQVRSHHFCSMQNEDFRQCVIYDSGEADAKLIGIEYIIASHLYEQLPSEEKKYWHSHAYEVTSGQLIAPNVPAPVENIEMKKLVGTYGKTWHTWQVDRGDSLPYGPPQLMMSFTADGQLHPDALAKRDADLGVSTEEKRKARVHLIPPEGIDTSPETDVPWRSNKAMEVQIVTTDQPFRPPSMPGIDNIRGVKGEDKPALT